MSIKNQIIFLLLLVCSSCQGDKPQKPKVFIEQDKMEQILMEIHISVAIAEEKANGNAALVLLIRVIRFMLARSSVKIPGTTISM